MPPVGSRDKAHEPPAERARRVPTSRERTGASNHRCTGRSSARGISVGGSKVRERAERDDQIDRRRDIPRDALPRQRQSRSRSRDFAVRRPAPSTAPWDIAAPATRPQLSSSPEYLNVCACAVLSAGVTVDKLSRSGFSGPEMCSLSGRIRRNGSAVPGWS